jgi:hypothetical protein
MTEAEALGILIGEGKRPKYWSVQSRDGVVQWTTKDPVRAARALLQPGRIVKAVY